MPITRPAAALLTATLIFLAPLLLLPLAGQAQGRAWQEAGLRGESVLALAVAGGRDERVVYAETRTGLWRYAAGGACGARPCWERADAGLPRAPLGGPALAAWRVAPGRPRQLYAITDAGANRQLYRSDDGGGTWRNIGPAPGQTARPPLAVLTGLSGAPDTLALVTDTRIQRSADGGATWTPGGPWPAVGAKLGATVAPVALLGDGATPDRLYALSAGGALWLGESGGRAWRAAAVTPPAGAFAVLTIAPSFGMRIWAADRTVLAYSPDSGASWITHPLPQAGLIAALLADPRAPDTLYAAHAGGRVYRSDDAGATWTALGALPARGITALALDPETRAQLYAATADGVWVCNVTPPGPAELPPAVPPGPTDAEPPLNPTATPAPSPTATATAAPSATASLTGTAPPSATASPTGTATPSPTPTRRPSATPPPPTATTTAEPTAAPTASPSARPPDPTAGPPPTSPPPTVPAPPTAIPPR